MNRRIANFALSLIALFLVLTPPHVLAATDQNYSYARIVRLSYVQGDVQVQRPEEADWEDALVNLPIRQGYQISTHQGRAEIEFESGAVARLAENTLLQFTELALADGGRLTQLSLFRGTATFYANLASDDRFLVTTPHFTVTVPRNARFRIDAADDGATASVNKGDITVDALGASYRVTKNRAFLFRVEGEQVTLARAPDADAWDRWVDNREEILSASREAVSNRYMRTAYSYGMSDLDYYGGWYNIPGYGHCWQPRGLSLGWSPYWRGQWMYLNGFGLTWVSFEPWGWTPYHFGHWVYLPGGWYWVPGGFHHWQPAIVYWVHLGGNRWGWGPRTPHDRPGFPPVNLPHGTVVTSNNNPRGYGSVDRRFERPAPGEIARANFVAEPPESFAEGARFRGRARTGAETADLPTTPNAPAASGVAASGYSGTPKITQPGDVARDEGISPRARGRAGETGVPSGIVYDPQQRKYVNSPDVPGRTSAVGRTDFTGTPAAPAARGYSGTTATPSDSPKIPTVEIRREAPTTVIQRDENRLPGRREQPQENAPARIGPWQSRQDAQPQPRQPSAPPPQSQPRNEQPRPAQQPHWQSQPRSTPPPQSQPRVEPARPASSSPASPRSESRERPTTRPPKGH